MSGVGNNGGTPASSEAHERQRTASRPYQPRTIQPPLSPLLCSITFDPAAEEAKEEEVQILTAELTRSFNLAGAKLKRLACAWLRQQRR